MRSYRSGDGTENSPGTCCAELFRWLKQGREASVFLVQYERAQLPEYVMLALAAPRYSPKLLTHNALPPAGQSQKRPAM
ncbi:hypothetical protein XELAEV_18031983mg [Xenopus laevis]|uniref:Uncharacterized protein n=1 Tax=Xenopus laevis TaxID=8355 RepID=A0A974CNM4_XENLA|nr:hypothetical protein XELAEV_18031983mg [Xenopus laevis]